MLVNMPLCGPMKPSERNLRNELSEPALIGSDSRHSLREIEEHVNRTYELDTNITEYWRKLPEIPSAEEILPKKRAIGEDENTGPELPENTVDGCWDTKAQYISAHYQLLREDAVAPLRKAVATYRADPIMNDDGLVSVYTQVYIIGYTSSRIGMATRVQFSFERAGKRIRWSQSKRLQQGAIVALSTPQDNFNTICKVAVVAGRPLAGLVQNPPQVDLFWGDSRDATFDSTEEYVMIEAKDGYFEANRHMLVALQKLMCETFPLSKELVALSKSMDTPKYVQDQPFRNLKSLCHTEETEGSPIGDAFDTPLNVNILADWPVIKGTKLGISQTAALKRILTKKLAIIQGPPGTGKTFVSISALKVMLDNWSPGDSPLIISAQTNHALDQLLTLIAPTEPNFVRLGSRTSKANEVVRERTLFEVRTKLRNKYRAPYGKFRLAKNALKELARKLRTNIENAVKQGDKEAELLRDFKVISADQYESLVDDQWVYTEEPELPPGVIPLWLGKEQIDPVPRCPALNIGFDEDEAPDFEELDEIEAEIGRKCDDDDMDALNGEYFPITEDFVGHRSYGGYTDQKIQSILDSTDNLWDIEHCIRGQVYRYLRRRLKDMQFDEFRALWKDYEEAARVMKIAKWEIDAFIIKRGEIKLIGCTTTGLSKYRGLLAALKPRILLVEEAAEALEGTTLAAIFESLEHLILVGDHKQLQAGCTLAHLHRPPYNLGVSMFERLVRNGMEYTMLNEQRRMIPEIRMLLNPFYDELKDHESVLDRTNNRRPIPGMGGKDSYFFHHIWPESCDDAASRLNIYEAEMVMQFYNYLVLNGTDHSKITILTFYNGQRKLLQKLLRKCPCQPPNGPFNVFTVDSYQGEENDVIILSLVRSNDEYNVGFLENENRAVVSLSRARRGLYIFGNTISLLMANNACNLIWGGVTDQLRDCGRFDLDGGLPLVCRNHGRETIVRQPDDWVLLAGGCNQKCGGQLDCGHPCLHQCHPFEHSEIVCKEPCITHLPCGHRCHKRCGDICDCECDIAQRYLKVSEGIDEPWHQNLDEVLDGPSGGSGTPSRVPLQTSRTSGGLSYGPQKWNEWNAAKHDRALADLHRSHQDSSPSNMTVYKETHRRVAIKDGARVSESGLTTRVIPRMHPVPAQQTVNKEADLSTSDDALPLPGDGKVHREVTADEITATSHDATSHATTPEGAIGHEPYTYQSNAHTVTVERIPRFASGLEFANIYDLDDDDEKSCGFQELSVSTSTSKVESRSCVEEDLISFD